MAEPGEELLEGDLGDGEYNELDADEEEALLADDNGYAGYNLPSVTTHRDVYISTSPDPKASRKIKVEDVEDVAEGDEILDNEDVLELGVEGNWNIDDLDSESQDQNRNSERKSSLFQMWIKQERNDSSEFSRNNEPEEVEEEQELNIPSDNSNRKTAFITSSADISQSHLHDDDDEDDHERRDRFTSERSMPGIVSLKSPDTKWGAIPDSLDSVITANTPRGPAQKSPRGGGGGGIGRGGHTTPGRRGGRGGLRPLPPPAQDSASHHKVLINPHFKGSTPAPSHFPQPHSGNNYRDAQQHYDQPGYHYQKQPEYQQYQPQYPPHSHPQYQEPPAYAHNAPRGQGPHPTSGQGPHYQDDWQNPVGGPQQQYQQHNYPGGYYEEAPAPPPNTWNSPGQPTYQDYNQRAPPPHPHPHHQSPHRPPHHQQPPHLPHHPGHPMRPPAPQSIHQIVSQQQPPPPGLEAEFQPRKVQFSNENKLITVQMYSESAAGDVRQSPAQMAPPRSQPPPDQYLNQPPGPFVHQGGPPRPFFPPPQHHQPYRPPGSFGPPDHQQPPRMFPPSPQNQSPRFSPRFKGGGFQRGGFSPQFRPRMMQPGPSPPNVYNPRLPGYHQHQPIKRAHPEPQVPHQPPFKQKRPNPNCPEGHPNNKTPPRTNKQRNLLEVQTVDNVPDTTTFSDQGVEEEFDEDDDEETQEYKRKIAEQKRLREKLLQEKEERRKLAAAAKQKELEERKVASQNVPNSQAESNPHNPAYSESSQPTVDASEGNRISVHQRIGVKPSPVNSHISPGSTQVTVFNQQQPTAFKIVRVRTKDGTVLIKKMPLNSAGQMMIQRPAHMPAPQHVVHHQPLPARQILQQMDPPPYQHQHHYQPPHPHPPAPQHQHIYPQQAAPLPPPPPQPPQEHNEYFQAQPNPPYQQPQPQPVQQPFYQQPTHQAPHPPPPQPPQIIHHHNPVPVVNSKRIVLDRPQTTSFKPNFQNRSRVRPVKSNASSNNSSVITIVPVNKNMTLGQRFTMQNQQVKKEQNKSQQEQKLPVQAQPGTKPNRTVINSVLNAGAPTIKIPLPPGPVTSKVVVDNLTAGTSRQQLVSMAEQVGEVKILTLDTSQKRASITFNNTKAATAFYQKFQRKMVNLSMINVSFVSE